MLTQAGVKFEDNRVEQADWPALKPSELFHWSSRLSSACTISPSSLPLFVILISETPNGSLPFLVVDGKEIGQSGAVAHYVAAEYGKYNHQ